MAWSRGLRYGRHPPTSAPRQVDGQMPQVLSFSEWRRNGPLASRPQLHRSVVPEVGRRIIAPFDIRPQVSREVDGLAADLKDRAVAGDRR